MQEKVSTDSLFRRVMRTRNLGSFLQQNETFMEKCDFCSMLSSLCSARNMVPERAILRAQIDRTYGHQLFNGTRRPSRDKVLQLAVGIGLTPDETQHLLQAAGKSALYPKLKRDAVLIYCLKNRLGMTETQMILQQYGLVLLGEAG